MGGSDDNNDDDNDEEEENGSDDSDDETYQDATNTATVNPNQEEDQTVTQDDTIIFGDDTADFDDANVAVPLALPIDVKIEEEEQPECPQGFTLNNNGQCERTITQPPKCPVEGFTFNPETDKCETTIPPSCPAAGDFEYNPETDLCESSTAPDAEPACEAGIFSSERDQCEQRQTQAPT